MDRTPIELESFHHVYNRGTDKRVVFNNVEDYKFFIGYLNILNDVEIKNSHVPATIRNGVSHSQETDRLVNIIAFCLMPNHFHMLLQELTAGGISKFMQKLSTGYTMYFNEKNNRSGALFQGRFKSKFVDSELYLLKVIDYIHLNPKNLPGSLNYEWSSFHDYSGVNKFGDILQIDALDGITEIPKGEEYSIWLSSQGDFGDIDHLSIDSKEVPTGR